eukprot:4692813-Amphidinium_carterae.1
MSLDSGTSVPKTDKRLNKFRVQMVFGLRVQFFGAHACALLSVHTNVFVEFVSGCVTIAGDGIPAESGKMAQAL